MKLNIRAKLFGAFGVLLIALITIGVVSIIQIGQVGNQADLLFTQNLKTETKTGILRRDMLLMREAILEYPMAPVDRRSEAMAKLNELEDAIASDLADLQASDAPRFFLMITWGNLHRDEGIDHRRAWKGSLSAQPGVFVLKRIIQFEATDRIVPRTELRPSVASLLRHMC